MLKWIRDLNLKHGLMKPLVENLESTLQDIRVVRTFPTRTSVAQKGAASIFLKKWNAMKLKVFVLQWILSGEQ